MPSIRTCTQCDVSFRPTPGSKGLYCSPTCCHIAKSKIYKTKAQVVRDEKIKTYLHNPTLCHQCKNIIDYTKRKNKFCSSNCAATFNNTGRIRSDESKASMSATMKDLYVCDATLKTRLDKSGPANPRYKDGRSCAKLRNCIVCNSEFTSTRKTCSDPCFKTYSSQRASDHLRKNRHKYVGPHQRSYMERTFVAWLESHGIQKGIYGYWDQVHFKHAPDGKMKNGWADFVFVSRRLVIELDGNHHKTRKHLDEIRDDHLSTRRGYKVIRITHTEYVKQTRLKQIESVLGI